MTRPQTTLIYTLLITHKTHTHTHTHTHKNTNIYPNRPKFQTSNIQYLKIMDTHGNKKYKI